MSKPVRIFSPRECNIKLIFVCSCPWPHETMEPLIVFFSFSPDSPLATWPCSLLISEHGSCLSLTPHTLATHFLLCGCIQEVPLSASKMCVCMCVCPCVYACACMPWCMKVRGQLSRVSHFLLPWGYTGSNSGPLGLGAFTCWAISVLSCTILHSFDSVLYYGQHGQRPKSAVADAECWVYAPIIAPPSPSEPHLHVVTATPWNHSLPTLATIIWYGRWYLVKLGQVIYFLE